MRTATQHLCGVLDLSADVLRRAWGPYAYGGVIIAIERAVSEERARCAAVARSWSSIGDAGEIAEAIERGEGP